MTKADNIFLVILGVTALLTIGVLAENMRMITEPEPVLSSDTLNITTQEDTERLRSGWEQKGINPRPARYWKNLP